MLWLIGWTVGCVGLAVVFIKDPQIGTLLFGIPFWASWLFVAGLLVWMIFGKETLLLRRDAALFRRTALINVSSRLVPRAEIQSFRECRSTHTENDHHVWGIEMVTLGKPLRFAYRLPDRERAWLVYQLNQFLASTKPDGDENCPPPAAPTTNVAIAANLVQPDTTLAACETLTIEHTLAEPPTDCDWSFDDEVSAFTFSERGRLQIGLVMGLLFINAFWNGIVSVFLCVLFGLMPQNNAPQGFEKIGLFVFLIPFEAIGLAMLAALVAALFEPVRRTTWRFEPDRIVRQTVWPVFRRTRAWNVAKLSRLELRRNRENDARRMRPSLNANNLAGEVPFELAFVSDNNNDLCSITSLTEGEARWFASIILTQRPKWLTA